MNRGRSVVAFVLCLGGATLFFWLVIHQISGLWLDVALRPEVTEALHYSMDDQKRLRALDTTHSELYRRQFENNAKLLHRLDVIRMSREQVLRRFELIFAGIFVILAAGTALALWSRVRRAQSTERQQYLDRVSNLQETARRHAHEIKGPLTAARLDLDRIEDALRDGGSECEIRVAVDSVGSELEALSRFTRQYATFAAIGRPVLRLLSLQAIVDEFCATFGNAWPGVLLRSVTAVAFVCADADMLRQILVNLCANSGRAIDGRGTVTFAIHRNGRSVALDVIDTGRGIPESLRDRVFDPYVTTQNVGEGMGLGLSISRKIMIDHGGDLQLLATSETGTTFRITFGENECS